MKNLITNSRTRWLGMVISTFILLLGSTHAWAWTINGRVYYDNTASAWTTSASQTIQYFPEKSDGSAGLLMTKLDHTKLYYWSGSWGSGSVSSMRFACVKSGSAWDWSGSSSWDRLYNNSNTVGMSGTWGIDVNSKSVLFRSGGAGSKTTASNLAGVDTYNNYSGLNFSQTVYKYTSTDNGSTYSASSTNSGTVTITPYKLTAEGTVSNSSNTGTLDAASETSVSKDAVYTGEVTLTASANTGYVFVGWFESTSASTPLSTETTYTYNAPKSTKSVYARFKNETVHQVTVSYTCASPSTTVKDTETPYVGEITPTTFTAGTPTGFTFSSWTVGNGLTITSGSESTNSISVKTKASGTYTLTANYTEDLSSPYIVTGGNKIVTSGITWRTTADANNSMVKKTEHSTESNAYFTVNVTATNNSGGSNANYKFKIYNTSTSTHYGFTADGDQYYLLRSESGTAKSLASGKNIELRADALGEYELKVNYSSDPTLIVTFPTAYTVNFGVRTGGSSASASYSSTAFSTGTKVQKDKSVTFTQSAATGYNFEGWYDASSGGTKKSSSSSWTTTVGSATLNAYANYTAKTYDDGVLNKNGGSAAGSYTVTYNATSITPSAPTKTGYYVEGYYTNAGCSIKVATPAGVLQSNVAGYTDATGHWNYDGTKELWTKWAANTHTVTLNMNGSYTSDGSATATYDSNTLTSITAPRRTGYSPEGYYTNSACTTKVATPAGALQASTDYTTAGSLWSTDDDATLYTKWTANKYDVTLKANTGTGDDQVVQATYDADMPTTLKVGGSAVTVHTKTGYNLLGYWDDASSGNQYYSYDVGTSTLSSYHTWNKTSATNLYAHWSAKGYTVTLDVDEDNKGTIAGADESASVTFDAAPTTIANRPTAANGYALDGYYTDQLGEGTKVINADGTWIASVLGYTDEDAHWIYANNLTLYAYYKKAEITELTLAAAIVGTAETDSITVTPTIDPSPTGTTRICWEIQYSNGTALPSQPAGRIVSGNTYRFKAPTASATYRIQATLRTGSSCDGGTELSTLSTTFQVAGEHTVTVRYQDADGRTLKASTEITGKPLEWTEDAIEAPTITGYTFDHWKAGDGVTLSEDKSSAVVGDESNAEDIYIKANYDGTLTAVYNKKNMIFFNNTLGWNDVYVYFYSSDKYWVKDHIEGQGCGTGSDKDYEVGGSAAYYRGYHGHMTQIEGTNIWYYDYEAEHGAKDGGEIKGYDDVVFVETEQNNYKFFYNNKASRRGDFNHSLPMFVPINSVTETKNGTKYYSSGYWMNYPENTGYSLLIYNQKTIDGATKLYEIPFEFTADHTMPMELLVDLEAGQTYGFEIKRADGNYYKNTGTMTSNTANWAMETGKSSYCGLQTTAAGDYTFNLFYDDSNYRVGVTYPVAVNDWRIVYTDVATWSKSAHTASWNHPSRVITKNSSATEVKKDTVSFFWSYGSSPAIKYQNCTATGTGSVTWNSGTAISVSDFSSVLTKKGIYNFIFEQPAGGASISLVKVEPYTGNFYIRTDCAGSTKWANFQSTDHQMTYSDYAETNSGYSHYYTHWVTTGQNVKFCIANDYSQCITDTLVEDIGTVIADITTEGNANAGRLNSGNANIRFMWNQATNKISRAYISGSSVISDRFLVLQGDAKMYDENGNALSISGLNANEINLVDDQNFVYERTIKVNTGAKAKLTANYNTHVQYFKGGSGTASEDSVLLLGGEPSATKHNMRIVYDFKTNRLMTAYVPSDTIKNDMAINADLMIVREHQEAGQQLLFNGGSLSEVHTVYGVMRFNRWTLNNKEKTGGHSPVGDPKSAYERGLYWISFPFDVNLSDVFGFGTYGTHWIMMEYDGAARAKEGYWADSEGFWKYVMPSQRATYELKAGKGYVLALDLDLMKDNNSSFWNNDIEQVELFFPSASYVSNIASTNVTTTVASHECTIDRTEPKGGADINKNRTKADSHWNIIGIPSYANYGSTLKDGAAGSTVEWHTNPYTNDLPFLYEWSTVDNTYSVQSGTTYPFKSMHAYMVQYHGNLFWSLASATPVVSPIVARRTYAEKPQNVEMRLELSQNEKKVDQTFVKLSNDENVSANFAFDEDLCKEYNANKANIYTFIENYIPAAGNTLPMSEQTMVVPVGVKIVADGDYTFAIPDGTEGIGVTLIDSETGIRTSLSALDYTINLTAGTYENRFVLEISPIQQMPTGIELLNGENGANGVRKVLIDGLLYIVKDGKMFDAQGRQVK